MTRLVLPGMVERSKGAILNISSASGIAPVPLLAIYSATKAFADFFSQCLHEEYKSKGIFVQVSGVCFNCVSLFLCGFHSNCCRLGNERKSHS
ncbi:very-long-chain 3-oxoacyl-CoA reductase-like [Leptonychotes weddellii]|uniref:Very-long-chain 3-oxoacyl-CoA reductase n=1 Tax=Leptonychotes weddellii TaxID=9713 RepID=A0A7F8QEA5_LEPWE|nr:very-long-chain 3-oxoacyl-CoA reductase-like [Leptonychotes weddellii]